MATSRSTLPAEGVGSERARRVGYALTTGALAVLMALLVLDGVGAVDVFGVDTERVEATGGGYTLTVTAASVSRPGLATPLEVRVRRAGGFDGPVEVAIDRDYLQHFDFNRMYPEPSTDGAIGELVVLEFDEPDGDELVVQLDARLEPAVQRGVTGRFAVLEDGEIVVEAESRLRVWP